jgi:cell wall-associated NlpC family hydrolase
VSVGKKFVTMFVSGGKKFVTRHIAISYQFINYIIFGMVNKEANMQKKYIIFIGLSFILWTSSANAQCKPGDILVGEDDNNWYCQTSSTIEELKELATDLYNYLVTGGPSEEMLGDEWRYRKAEIEATRDLANRGYKLGAKVHFNVEGKTYEICVADECKGQLNTIDCSGYVEYAASSACFVRAYSTATCGKVIRGIQNNANNQMQLFKNNKVFLPKNGNPKPGDLIFLEKTYKLKDGTYPKGASHVAIYLGKKVDGKIKIMHAGKSKVGFTDLPSNWYDKILGYGNISKLIVIIGE